MAPFESFGTVLYSSSIITMALSCIIFEIKRDIGRKLRFFIPVALDAAVRGFPSEYRHAVWCGRTRMVYLSNGGKRLMIFVTVSTKYCRVTNRWRDGQTDILPKHSPCYVYASRGKNRMRSLVAGLRYIVCNNTEK